MEEVTQFMLNVVLSCVSGYPKEVMPHYAEVFQMILENDKYLQGKRWDRERAYENKKFFDRQTKAGR